MLVGSSRSPALWDSSVPSFYLDQKLRFEFCAADGSGAGREYLAPTLPMLSSRKGKMKRKRIIKAKSPEKAAKDDDPAGLSLVEEHHGDSHQWSYLPLDIIGIIAIQLKQDQGALESMRFINRHWSNGVNSTITLLKPLQLYWGTGGMARTIRAKFTSLVELRLEHRYGREAAHGNLLEDHVGGLTWLQSLRIQTPLPIDSGMEVVGGLTSLTSLDLGMCFQLSDAGVQHLTNLKKLKSLDLEFCPLITVKGLEFIAKLPSLTNLNLVGNRKAVAREGLELLAGLASLKTLSLGRGKFLGRSEAVKVEGLDALTSLIGLHRLELCTATVEFEEVKALTAMKNLTNFCTLDVDLMDESGEYRQWQELEGVLPLDHSTTKSAFGVVI
ncbi:hypothetical protein BSKO_02212 [Bryopsis sp. KO-2023]|nr:hypothetical protein BSKO_02212 [Bryopsis sp. KO-2023]